MPTKVPLQSIVLTSTASSVTFYGIDQTYMDLELIVTGTSDYTPVPDVDTFCLRFNGDSTSLYSNTGLTGDGTNAASGRNSAQTLCRLGQIGANTIINAQPIVLNILNYSNSTTFKTVLTKGGTAGGKSTATISINTGLYRSTNPITSITVYPGSTNFTAGSTFDLYGISPVNAVVASASGGTDISYDNTYVYHVFKGTGTFTPTRALTADILVVAGGGGGGRGAQVDRGGGGGGAGGYRYLTSQSLSSGTSYSVIIGAGGVADSASTTASSGSNSSFGSTNATGGGRAGIGQAGDTTQNGASGGSGGGATSEATVNRTGGSGNAGSYSPVEGYAGGNANTARGGGGGGGSAGVGGNATTGTGGAGGAGTSNSITGTAVTYAAGGNGGNNTGSSVGSSGTTNLGNGGNGGNGFNGTGTPSSYSGGNGGSGIVIVRYTR